MNAIIPIPKITVDVRLATLDDFAFIDQLQKKHHKQLGFFPRAQIDGYLRNQWILVAEENGSPIGYIAWRDRYQKRDELGAIFQLCVSDQARRKLVGAMLVKAAFDRSAYGCRLFCCWCAQDIQANRFWESLGFVPLAFRAGSRTKDRVHIFWQKRIRSGDTTTPYWFPSQTGGGSIREDRLVLPIPPGVRWDDEMPRILPAMSGVEGPENQLPVASGQLPVQSKEGKALPSPRKKREKPAVSRRAYSKAGGCGSGRCKLRRRRRSRR